EDFVTSCRPPLQQHGQTPLADTKFPGTAAALPTSPWIPRVCGAGRSRASQGTVRITLRGAGTQWARQGGGVAGGWKLSGARSQGRPQRPGLGRGGRRRSDRALCHPGGVAALLSPPHQAPGDPQHTVPGHLERQTPSGQCGESCRERREGRPTEPPRSPGAWTRWRRLLGLSPGEGVGSRGLGERGLWPGPGTRGAGGGVRGRWAVTTRPGRRPGASSPALTATAPASSRPFSAPTGSRGAPPSCPPLPAGFANDQARLVTRPAPRKPGPSGVTGTSVAQSKEAPLARSSRLCPRAVFPRPPAGPAAASRCPHQESGDCPCRVARVVRCVHSKPCLCAFGVNLYSEGIKFTGSYTETSKRPEHLPQFPQRQPVAQLGGSWAVVRVAHQLALKASEPVLLLSPSLRDCSSPSSEIQPLFFKAPHPGF
ncbi:uncharacterized protein, partial [Eschrichtius robustus]|uniref:uncharacterized protein n=1 Tax=Eschrichtius robustus TaxID=9764 RepID=UPI0035C04FA8